VFEPSGPAEPPTRRTNVPSVSVEYRLRYCASAIDAYNVYRPLSDNVNARAATMNVCHLPKTGGNSEKNLMGVQTVTGDSEKVRGWDLLTHGGFLTYPHHDACGLATYVTVRSGKKIWAYLDTPNGSTQSRQALFKDWDKIFVSTIELKVPDGKMGTVVLGEGDTL
jgi:hypothetical protein